MSPAEESFLRYQNTKHDPMSRFEAEEREAQIASMVYSGMQALERFLEEQ